MNPYDEVPYPSHSFAQTHPRRLAAMARLFGMHPPDPGQGRVLELGCASGGNLIPLAASNPGVHYVGVDYGARHIDAARAWAAAVGLTNVEFVCADLRTWSPVGRFDYVLCHGVFSWVPDDVRAAILRVIRAHLSPMGVAYLSYNALPGWRMFGIIRETMLFFARRGRTPLERVAAGREALAFLAASVPPTQGAYSRLLTDAVDMIAGHADEYLFHEYLEENNDAFWFHEIAARADQAGLQYLGESNLSAMLDHTLGGDVSQQIRRLSPGIVALEQYMDVVRNRTFRQTLLVHREVPLSRDLGAAPFDALHACAGGQVLAEADGTWTLEGDAEVTVSTESPEVASMFSRLCDAWPRGVPLAEIWRNAPADVLPHLRDGLLSALSVRLIDVSVGPFPCAGRRSIPRRPRAAPVAATLAAHTHRVPNLRNESYDLDPLDQRIVQEMTGERALPEIVSALYDPEMGDGPELSLVTARVEALAAQGFVCEEEGL